MSSLPRTQRMGALEEAACSEPAEGAVIPITSPAYFGDSALFTPHFPGAINGQLAEGSASPG